MLMIGKSFAFGEESQGGEIEIETIDWWNKKPNPKFGSDWWDHLFKHRGNALTFKGKDRYKKTAANPRHIAPKRDSTATPRPHLINRNPDPFGSVTGSSHAVPVNA